MATITLEGIRFFGYHGVLPEEQEEGNEFEMDVSFETLTPPPVNDEIDEVIDYSDVFNVVVECTTERVNLLETLVFRTGRKILDFFPEVKWVRIRLAKLDPPLPGECSKAILEETFKR